MSPAEEVKSYLYYNSLRACIENHRLNSMNGDRISVDNATSGQWFYRGDGTSPTAGYYLSVANAGEIQEKIHCGTGDNSWIIDAAKLWGYANGIDMLCDTGASRVNGSDCRDGSGGFHGVRMGATVFNSRLKVDTFEKNVKDKVYSGNSPNSLTGAAQYLLNRNVFYAGCLDSVSPSPYTGSANDDYLYKDVTLINISDGTTYKVNFYGKKKASDKVGKLINNSRNNVNASCADLVKEMNGYSSSYAQWVRDEIEAGNIVDDSADECADNPDAPGCSGDEVTTCAIDGIGWIICPVMNFMGSIADGSFNFLSGSFLETNSSIARADDGNPVYEAWKAMRNLANALFVIAFIIIVYSQMTGAGISNYGVKRMLPRLVMAAVLVNVSFFICQLAVDLSNVLGYSLKNFFEGLAANATGGVRPDISVDATGAGYVGFFGGLVAAVLISGSVYLFASALFPILLGAVVALVMILFILLARQALIILLIVVAPVAFVAFLLPNTQKLFTQWRKAFTAVMMVFPIIGVVFGVSLFASAVITAASNPVGTGVESSFWGQIIGAGIAVLPLFVVPGILKKSLDGVGNIGARINSIGGRLQGAANKKGAAAYGNSRLAQFKNYRAQNAARRRTLVQSGAYDGGNPLRRWTSAANKKLNESKISGKFGDRSVAKGAAIINKEQEELLNEEMATYEARPLTKLEDAKKNFEAAVKSGDSLKASAAIKVLSSMKTKGADEIKALLEEHGGKMPDNVMSATRSMLAGNADPVLNAMSFMPGSYEQLRDNPSTYKSLNAEKIAGMSASSIKHAMKVGGLDSQIVSSLLSPNSNYSLTSDQREALGGTSFIDAANAQAAEQSKPEYGSIDLRTRADAADQSLAEPAATDSQSQSVVQPENTNDVPPPQSGPTFTPPA